MTRRRLFCALALGGLLAASPAVARSLAESIARQLTQQGFGDVQVEDTWLGRARITGTRGGEAREIVVNPKTGEVLRDLWLNSEGQVRAFDIDVDDADDAGDDGGKGRGRGGDSNDSDSSGSSDGDSGSDSDSSGSGDGNDE